MPQSALVANLQAGDHVCWTFDDDHVRDRVVAAFVSAAVTERHKAAYFPHSSSRTALVRLAGAGIDVDGLTASGQLEVVDAPDVYLHAGRFDAAAMLESVRTACVQARAQGFAGLRLVGDGSWAASPVPGADRLGWYEAQATRIFAEENATGLCLYDRRLFTTSCLRDISAQHPAAVDPLAGSTWRPLLRVRPLADTGGLRLEGEVDLSNRGCFEAALEHLGPPDPGRQQHRPAAAPPTVLEPPVLDVTDLRFMDVAAARSIVQTATRIGGLRVTGASRHLRRLLMLLSDDRHPELLVEPALAPRPTER